MKFFTDSEFNKETHISQNDFNSLKDLLSELNDIDRKELQQIVESINFDNGNNVRKKDLLKNKVLLLLKKHGRQISYSLTASCLFELLKKLCIAS